jgi:hypothetical protein
MVTRSGEQRSRAATAAALAVSFAIHCVLIAASARWLREATRRPESVGLPFEVALMDVLPRGDAIPVVASDSLPRRSAPEEQRPSPRAGPLREPRPDTRRTGRGGTTEAPEKALHL